MTSGVLPVQTWRPLFVPTVVVFPAGIKPKFRQKAIRAGLVFRFQIFETMLVLMPVLFTTCCEDRAARGTSRSVILCGAAYGSMLVRMLVLAPSSFLFYIRTIFTTAVKRAGSSQHGVSVPQLKVMSSVLWTLDQLPALRRLNSTIHPYVIWFTLINKPGPGQVWGAGRQT